MRANEVIMGQGLKSIVVAVAFVAIASLAAAQVRMSQPINTGQGPTSGVNPDSGAGGDAPPPPPRTVGAPLSTPSGSASPTIAPPAEGTDELGTEGEADDEAAGHGGYDPEGRRDPFRPLTGEAADTDKRKKYEHELYGRLLSEVKLTSIVKTPHGNIATFEGGPRKEGYFAHVGDKFWDGQVIEIDYDSKTVVVRQQLNDPRLIKPYRDQVIPLYSEEESAKSGDQGGGN